MFSSFVSSPREPVFSNYSDTFLVPFHNNIARRSRFFIEFFSSLILLSSVPNKLSAVKRSSFEILKNRVNSTYWNYRDSLELLFGGSWRRQATFPNFSISRAIQLFESKQRPYLPFERWLPAFISENTMTTWDRFHTSTPASHNFNKHESWKVLRKAGLKWSQKVTG